MGTLALDGLASGLDTTSIIQSLVAVAGASMRTMQARVDEIDLARTKWQSFNSLLGSLKNQIDDMNSASEFKKMKVTSEDTSLVTAEVTGTALPGKYTVNVTSVASSQTSVYSKEFADGSTDFSDSITSLTFTVGGVAQPAIDVTGLSLDEVITEINDTGMGVFAYKVQNSDGNYELALTSEDTGLASAFSVALGGVAETPATSFSEEVAAADTVATISGIEVSSSTGDITDAIPGVTLSVLDLTGGEIDVVVSPDLSAIKDNIKSFVSKYNDVANFIFGQLNFSAVTGSAGALSGDPTLRNIQNALQSLVRADYAVGDIDNLAKLGISTNAQGSLVVDDTELSEALDDNFSAVIDFFTEDDGFLAAFTNAADDGRLDFILDDSGMVQDKIDSLDDQIENLNERIEKEQVRLEKVEDTLRKKFTALEVALATLETTKSYVSNVLGKSNSNKS